MEYIAFFILIGIVLGLCYLADKGLGKLFRGKKQHQSGLKVKPAKRYATIGVVIGVLGAAAMFTVKTQGWLLFGAGALLVVVAAGLLTYYLTFGIYYDADSFLVSRFGRRSIAYEYKQIQGQQLYTGMGNVLIELHMDDGKTVTLQSSMVGVYPFMDKAFYNWLRQTGREQQDCPFFDPQNSCWFPPVEV